MDTSNAPSTSSGRSVGRYVIGALATLLLVTAIAVETNDSSAGDQPDVLFGCAGTMVISNVDCEMGAATAFDVDLSSGLAPWCDGQTDMTIYGCFDGSNTEVRTAGAQARARQVQCHQHVPTLHPDGATQASENPCEGDSSIDEVLVSLAANNVHTRRCLALTHPGPACIP